MTATLSPTENQTFDSMFGFIAAVFQLPDDSPQVVKGFQNLVSNPIGTYAVISPGLTVRQDFGRWDYDPAADTTTVVAHNTYSYQVDCYGADGATWASILAATWRTMWGATTLRDASITPLYADAPQQLNIVNREGQFEQRWMIRLFAQVNQRITLPQQFFSEAELRGIVVADQLP